MERDNFQLMVHKKELYSGVLDRTFIDGHLSVVKCPSLINNCDYDFFKSDECNQFLHPQELEYAKVTI